jgi:hypothetical protein
MERQLKSINKLLNFTVFARLKGLLHNMIEAKVTEDHKGDEENKTEDLFDGNTKNIFSG